MTDWDLIRWFLNLNILIAYEFTLFDLQNKITFNHVLYTFLTWAFNFWCKLFAIDALVHFKSTSITCVYCNLHARFNSAASGHNTLNGDKSSNRTSLNVSHLHKCLFCCIASWNNL